MNKLFINRFPAAFPVDDTGKPTQDHIASLVDMFLDPSLAPGGLTLRSLGGAGSSDRRIQVHDSSCTSRSAATPGSRRRRT